MTLQTMNNITKSTTIELSLNPEYVPDWGVWEAVRELLQNAADANDIGCPMSVTRTAGGTVKITNRGADLGRETLLLGTSSKRGDARQRGQFGEGFKLALSVLTRLGVRVVAHTRHETWTPIIEHSTAFGAHVVKVKVRAASRERDGVTFTIDGVSDADWAIIRRRCLFLDAPVATDVVEVGGGRIMLGAQYKGQLFVKGLAVGVMPDDYAYGYDLDALELDRDRKMASPWSLRYEVAQVLRRAVQAGHLATETLASLLTNNTGEAVALKERYAGSYADSADEVTARIAEHFIAQHGENAIPVTNMDQSIEAAHLGLKGVMVTPAMAAIVERQIGDFQKHRRAAEMRPVKVWAADDLTASELATYVWGTALLRESGSDLSDVDIQVADFRVPTLCGVFNAQSDGRFLVYVARSQLASRSDFISTLVHEVSHKRGSDATVEHVRAMEALFGAIIEKLSVV